MLNKQEKERLDAFSSIDLLVLALKNQIASISAAIPPTTKEHKEYSLVNIYGVLKTLRVKMTEIDLARLFMCYLKEHVQDPRVSPFLNELEELLLQVLHRSRGDEDLFSKEVEKLLQAQEKEVE